MVWRPRIRTVLLGVNLAILLLPVAGIAVMRFYNNELIRQTESTLIAQGAFVAAAFREALLSQMLERSGGTTSPDHPFDDYGIEAEPQYVPLDNPTEPLSPVLPHLAVRQSRIRPRAPDAISPATSADSIAVAAGERITPILLLTRRITLAGIRVVDFRGTVVASTAGEMYLSLVPREEVRRALEGENVSLLRQRVSDAPAPPLTSLSRQSDHRVFVAMPVRAGSRVLGGVVLSRSPMSVAKALYMIRYPALGAGLVIVAVSVLVSILTAFTIARPVSALIRQTERASGGERGAVRPLERPGTHEIGLLSQAFAKMAGNLEARADYIRGFASNVSHEFKTPLTSLRGTVELLRDHLEEMTGEERNRFLDNLDADTERLDRLVGRLLELARADVLEPTSARCSVGVVMERVAARYRERGMTIETRRGAGEDEVAMDEDTLESILSNLLDNARQHGGEGVWVGVTTRRGAAMESGDREAIWIEVVDNGPGISDANAGRVFDEFFTTARGQGGTGLGLSIVSSLLRAHDGSIALRERGKGTSFRIMIPE